MISINHIHFTYPSGVHALNGVSLEIADGEFVAIMGQNGAGKTTLVKHLNGLLKPTRGEVIVDGIDTRTTSVAKLARNVGFVFQNPDHQLFCETVEDEISFALKNFGFEEGNIQSRITWALELLDLSQFRESSPFVLSGGERKRVALASVLAWNPKVIVMDEPTIGQDYRQKEKLRQFIVQLNAQGKTVIVVTHDVEFVAECDPRVILMREGEVVADGPGRLMLTNIGNLVKASITPPQVTQILMGFMDYRLPVDIIDLYDAKKAIRELLGE